MEALASYVETLYFGQSEWAAFLFVFFAPYVVIGLLVRSTLLSILLGGLAGLAVLSILFFDTTPFGDLSVGLKTIGAGYGAIMAGVTNLIRRFLWRLISILASRPAPAL